LGNSAVIAIDSISYRENIFAITAFGIIASNSTFSARVLFYPEIPAIYSVINTINMQLGRKAEIAGSADSIA
jgi:hypothetical protein